MCKTSPTAQIVLQAVGEVLQCARATLGTVRTDCTCPCLAEPPTSGADGDRFPLSLSGCGTVTPLPCHIVSVNCHRPSASSISLAKRPLRPNAAAIRRATCNRSPHDPGLTPPQKQTRPRSGDPTVAWGRSVWAGPCRRATCPPPPPRAGTTAVMRDRRSDSDPVPRKGRAHARPMGSRLSGASVPKGSDIH